MPISLLNSAKQEVADILFLKFDVHGIEPGRYLLNLLAEDAATKSSSQTTSGFWVRSPEPQKR
jgi:hypothetical protein